MFLALVSQRLRDGLSCRLVACVDGVDSVLPESEFTESQGRVSGLHRYFPNLMIEPMQCVEGGTNKFGEVVGVQIGDPFLGLYVVLDVFL